MKSLYTLLLLTLATLRLAAQTGEIAGIVLDEKKQPIIGAIVQVTQGGITKGGAATGIDGDYLIKPLDPGLYNVSVTYMGYAKFTVTEMTVGRMRVEQNFNMLPWRGNR